MIATSEGLSALLRTLEAMSELEANTFRKHAQVRAPWQAAPGQDVIDVVLFLGQDPQDEPVLAAASEAGFGSVKTVTVDQAIQGVKEQLSKHFAEKAIDKMANPDRLADVGVETPAPLPEQPVDTGTGPSSGDKWAAFKDVLSLASAEEAHEDESDA
jgi:hypothetical protein